LTDDDEAMVGCPAIVRALRFLTDGELPPLLPHELEHVYVSNVEMITHVGNLGPLQVSGVFLPRHDAIGVNSRDSDHKWISGASVSF
jgi:hypothetical protein